MSNDIHWNCARCGLRTSDANSVGMLKCAYHPHLEGLLKPTRRPNAQLNTHDFNSTDGCKTCASVYIGLDTLLRATNRVEIGYTSIDHSPLSGKQFETFLALKPYAVFPLHLSTDMQNRPAFFKNYTHIIRRRKRRRGDEKTTLNTITIRSDAEMCDVEGDSSVFYLHLKLFGPRASDCANAEEGSEVHVLSLESLYNECAAEYNYAPYKSSNWMRNALHKNRHIMKSAGDSYGGGSIGIMSVEDVYTKELYAAENVDDSVAVDFVPFIIVPRVETEYMRIVKF